MLAFASLGITIYTKLVNSSEALVDGFVGSTSTSSKYVCAAEDYICVKNLIKDLNNSEKKLLASELRQLKQQISDSKSELLAGDRSLDLVREEEKIMVPMVERGYEPELKLIQLKQKIEDSINRRQRIEND